MTIAQIETNLQELINFFSAQTFAFDLLLAYGFPKSTLARLEKGDLNLLESKCKQHSRKILAQLYNPDKMPVDLKNVHHQLDLAIERCCLRVMRNGWSNCLNSMKK
ncbi:MAG: hypothetical protein NTY39_08745 [Campylobacterales bacterium]|nr:hypothetical protein [Campylobacterales bacterium]